LRASHSAARWLAQLGRDDLEIEQLGRTQNIALRHSQLPAQGFGAGEISGTEPMTINITNVRQSAP